MISSYNFRFKIECVLCVPYCVFTVMVKVPVPLFCVYVCILPEKTVLEMTYTALGPTQYSLTYSFSLKNLHCKK